MYRTTLKSLNPPRGSNGEYLEFIGDFSPSVGDTVWTDGRVIYGHVPRYDVSFIPSNNGGIPIASYLDYQQTSPNKSYAERGYYKKNGEFKQFDIESEKFLLNDSTNVFFIGSGYLDATIYQGNVYAAKKVGHDIQIIKDPETENERIYETITPPEQGDYCYLNNLIFSEGLDWTIWGYCLFREEKVLETTMYRTLTSGGYELLETDIDGTTKATRHYRFYAPTVVEHYVNKTQFREWSYSFTMTSNGTQRNYDERNWVHNDGWEAAEDGEFYTETINSAYLRDIGWLTNFWEGTCDCVSTDYYFGEFIFWDSLPLTNMNITNHVCTEHDVSVDEVVENTHNEYYPYTYNLNNGFQGVVEKNKSSLYDKDFKRISYYNNSEARYTTTYQFNNGDVLMLSQTTASGAHKLSYYDSNMLTIDNLGQCKNYSLEYLKNINKARKKET